MYDLLEINEFGRQLIETEDLDPLYIALNNSGFNKREMCKWLVAYWCYYHAGLCCEIAEQKDFWKAMIKVAKGGTDYPRGTERRHFRGKLAIESIGSLQKTFKHPSDMMRYLIEGSSTAKHVRDKTLTLKGFGKWISWKVPDMIERLGISPIQFVPDDVNWMFKSSLQGAKESYERYKLKGGMLLSAHNFLIRHVGRYKAPPRYDRRVNVQETETIFCKWHSHLGGHYPMGKDTREIALGLQQTIDRGISRKLVKRLLNGLQGARNG